MLIVSQARIRVDRRGRVAVEGLLRPYETRIRQFIADLGLRRGTIRYRRGRYQFSRRIGPRARQRLLNFLHNECPLPG